MPIPMAKGAVPGGVDPMIHWRLVELSNFHPREIEGPSWWSVLMELANTSIERFVEQLQGISEGDLDSVLHLPWLYRARASEHRDRQIVTLYATQAFFELIFDRKEDLGIIRVLLGRLLPPLLRNFDPPHESPSRSEAPPAGAIMAIIDEGIAFAHELFRRADGGSRVEYAWLLDGTPPNRVRGREIDRAEIDALLAQHTHAGWLDEEAFYRDAGLIDFANDLHKTAAFRRAHGTHIAALAAGHQPGTVDDSLPLILVQLSADMVADTSGDRIEAELNLAIDYIMARADAIALARGMGDDLPLVINFSFGTYAGSHDGTDVVERLFDRLVDETPRKVRVVLPAGNNNLVRSHAELDFSDGQASKTVHWRVLPDDKSASYVEIWLPHRGPNPPDLVQVEVRTPDGQGSASVASLPGSLQDLSWNGAAVGRVYYELAPFPTERGVIRIAIRPTAHEAVPVLAPNGLWRITVTNKALKADETVHLRIQRNESLPDYPARGRQSFFDDPCYQRLDAIGRPLADDPAGPPCAVKRRGTLSAFASGGRSVVIGSYVRGNGEVAVYSAGGPATPMRNVQHTSRYGPDALAAADDSPALAGVMSAGSRSGAVLAMSGTSVAAPQVARWLAEQLAAGAAADRAAVQQRATGDEQRVHWPAQLPDEARSGGGRLCLPAQPGRPRRQVPPRP